MSERFLLRRDRVVQAGAGTGKTHALLTQYLHLCAGLSARREPLLPRAICALTFTDKAAGEMRERLQRRTGDIVRAIADTADAGEIEAALRQLGEPDLIESAAALGRPLPPPELWQQVLAQLPGAPIGTFHSFAAGLLRRYAALAGLDPDFVLLDEDSARSLLMESAEQAVLQALEGRLDAAAEKPAAGDAASVPKDAAELVEQAARLVGEYGFSGGPSADGGVVEALCRLHRLRSEEGRDAAGLAASYQAPVLAAELERIRAALLGGLLSLGLLATQLGAGSAERATELGGLRDAVAAQLRHPEEAALAAALPLCELVLQGIKKLRAKKDAAGTQEELGHTKERIKTAAEEVRALHASLRAAPLAVALERLLAPVAAAYDRAKQAAGALDFTDLLRKTRDLLRDHPAVRLETQGRFAVLLVDEFQDTNPLQAELLELLAGPLGSGAAEPSPPREPGRLYIVGDRKQSIYEFRGADVAAYTSLCARLVAGGADEETLSRSYRSRPAVLNFVSTLFAAVMPSEPPAGPSPQFFVRWDPRRDPLHAVRPEDPAVPHPVELVRSAAPPPSAQNDSDPAAAASPSPAAAVEPHALDREAELLAQRIAALRDQGARLGDMVVLLRRFTHLFRYTLALKRAGIAHYVVRGRGFYQAQEVLDVAALLTLLSDPEDRLALLTLLRSPLCGLSDDSLLRLHLGGRLTLPTLLRERRGLTRRVVLGTKAGEPPPENRERLASVAELGDELIPYEADEDEGPPLELLGEDRAAPPEAGLPADETARLQRLLDLIAVLLRLGDRLGPSGCLQVVYDHTDLLAILAADADGEQRVANLLRLHERAREFDRSGGLRSFVRALRLYTDPQLKTALGSGGDEPAAQIAGEADDVVRIMTVHQAKGLEFPIVFVAGCTTRERSDSPAIAYDRAVGLGLTVYEDGDRVRTLAARQVDAHARQRASAESARLFYVAATRARERLIFLGELGPRPRLAGTWRASLEALGEASPEQALPPIVEWRPGPPVLPAAPVPVPGRGEALLHSARRAAALVYAEPTAGRSGPPTLGETPLPAAAPLGGTDAAELVGVAATAAIPCLLSAAAAELLVCPRRFHLRTTARLFPPGPVARPSLSEEAAGEPIHVQLRSGSLAGQLLAMASTDCSAAELEALVLGIGLDPAEPRVLELRTHLARFLAEKRRRGSLLGRLLAAPSETPPDVKVERCVPFVLTAAGGTVRLHGVLDVLHRQATPQGAIVTVLDYHYGCAPDPEGPEGPLHTTRRALLALAASWLHPDAAELRTGLCFLHEADPRPVLRPVAPEALAALHSSLAHAAPLTQLPLPAALRLPVLPSAACSALGCEYQPLCHPRPLAP